MTSQLSGAMQRKPLDCAHETESLRQTPDIATKPAYEGSRLVIIAGPCLLESAEHAWRMANALNDIAMRLDLPAFSFKASYRKANRTRHDSPRAMVSIDEAIALFDRIERELGLVCCTDVHDVAEARLWLGEGHMLQIPALLSRQTELIEAAAGGDDPDTYALLNIKKGQFMSALDAAYAVEKAKKANPQCHVVVTERGNCFGYDNLVVDMRNIMDLTRRADADEVLFDCTHSVMRPGMAGTRGYIDGLARAALVAGADGLFAEVHDDPRHAPSDAAVQIPLKHFEEWLKPLIDLHEWATEHPLAALTP